MKSEAVTFRVEGTAFAVRTFRLDGIHHVRLAGANIPLSRLRGVQGISTLAVNPFNDYPLDLIRCSPFNPGAGPEAWPFV